LFYFLFFQQDDEVEGVCGEIVEDALGDTALELTDLEHDEAVTEQAKSYMHNPSLAAIMGALERMEVRRRRRMMMDDEDDL
jgi:hypothetical protein